MKSVEQITEKMLKQIEGAVNSFKRFTRFGEYDEALRFRSLAYQEAYMYGWATDDWSVLDSVMKETGYDEK